MTSYLHLNLTETEASSLHPQKFEDEEKKEEWENGKESKNGKRSWQLPLTAFAFTISSAPFLCAEEVKEKKEEEMKETKEEMKEKKVVAVPHLNAEEKKKASEEKKMVMGKSQEDRIRFIS